MPDTDSCFLIFESVKILSMKKNITKLSSRFLPVILFLVLPFFSFKSGNLAPETLVSTKIFSPDVKSWSFVRQVIGSKYDEVKEAFSYQGYRLDDSSKNEKGTTYYYIYTKSKFDHPKTGEVEEEYSLLVNDGIIRKISMQFMIPSGKDHTALHKRWDPFEKGFLADKYLKIDEKEDEKSNLRFYENTSQHTKMTVYILLINDVYQEVEVVLSHEDWI